MTATPKAKLHDSFTEALTDLASQATDISKGIRGTGQRAWQYPSSLEESPLAIDKLDTGFDREEINTNYEETIADGASPGTVGDVVALKTQGDYLAVMERAFRARHATPVRCLAHAAGRRKGHGHAKGIFQGGLVTYIQDAIKAGSQPAQT